MKDATQQMGEREAKMQKLLHLDGLADLRTKDETAEMEALKVELAIEEATASTDTATAPKTARRRSTPREAIAEKRREPKELPLVQIRLEYTGETEGKFIVLSDESAKREAAIDAIQRDAVEVFEGRIKRFKVVADE